jgi:hypothetical protein
LLSKKIEPLMVNTFAVLSHVSWPTLAPPGCCERQE